MNTEQINYEEQVKGVYPDAYVLKLPLYLSVMSKVGGLEIASAYFLGAAWSRAYETLVKQGKIKEE